MFSEFPNQCKEKTKGKVPFQHSPIKQRPHLEYGG